MFMFYGKPLTLEIQIWLPNYNFQKQSKLFNIYIDFSLFLSVAFLCVAAFLKFMKVVVVFIKKPDESNARSSCPLVSPPLNPQGLSVPAHPPRSTVSPAALPH